MISLFLRFSLFWNSSKVLMIDSCVISLFVPFAKLTDDDCRDICIGGGLDSVDGDRPMLFPSHWLPSNQL